MLSSISFDCRRSSQLPLQISLEVKKCEKEVNTVLLSSTLNAIKPCCFVL